MQDEAARLAEKRREERAPDAVFTRMHAKIARGLAIE